MTAAASLRATTRKPRGQGGERREEILEHAQHLFAAHGVHSVSTRQIADAVGISQPTLYAYFPNKGELLDEVSVRAFERLHRAAHEPHGGADALERMVRGYIAFGLENPDAYRIAFMLERPVDPCIDPQAFAEKMQAARQAFDSLRRVVADRLGPGHPDVEVAAQSLWAGMHGLVSLLLARAGFPWVERERLIDRHVACLLGCLPPAAGGAG